MCNDDEFVIEPTCSNCHRVFPAEPWVSDYAICLQDPEFEPYIDGLIERNDFSKCQELVDRKRFPWEREACENFDPIEIDPADFIEDEDEVVEGAAIKEWSVEQITKAIDAIDWARRPVEPYLRNLEIADSFEDLRKVLGQFGFLIANRNQAAFEALCGYLRCLPPPSVLSETHARIEILRQLGLAHKPDQEQVVAELLVDDLFRTPSNQTTRGWYTAVFNYFERNVADEMAMCEIERILESPDFSKRIKERVSRIF